MHNITLGWSSLIHWKERRKRKMRKSGRSSNVIAFPFLLDNIMNPIIVAFCFKRTVSYKELFSKNVEITVHWDRSLYIPVEGFEALNPFFLVLTFVSQAADLFSSLSHLKKSKYAIIEKLHCRFWHCVPDLIRYNITEHILWVKIGYAILPDKNSSFCKTKISCFVWNEKEKTKITSMFDAFTLHF